MDFLYHYLSPNALLRSKDCVVDTILKGDFYVLDSACISCPSPEREPEAVGGHRRKRDLSETCLQGQSSSKRSDMSSTGNLKRPRMVPDDHLDSSHEDYFRNVFKAKTLRPEELKSEGLMTIEYTSASEQSSLGSVTSSPWDASFQCALAELDNLEREDEVVDYLTKTTTLGSCASSSETRQATLGDDSLGANGVDSDGEESEPESEEEEIIKIGSFSRFGALLPPFPRKDDQTRRDNADSCDEEVWSVLEHAESEEEFDDYEHLTPELTTDASPSACDTTPATPSEDVLGGDKADSVDEDLKKDRDYELFFDNGPFSRFGPLLPPFPRKGDETWLDTIALDSDLGSVPEEVTPSRKVSNIVPLRPAAIDSEDEGSGIVSRDGGVFDDASDDEAYVPSEDEETEEVADPGPSRQRGRKRKREIEIEEALDAPEPTSSRTKKGKNTEKANEGLKKKETNKVFNVDFLLERFRFTPVHDADKSWKCPFPPSTPARPACQDEFRLTPLWTHVSSHVAELRGAYKNTSVPCPFSECAWRSPNSRPVEKIGLNDSLVRHILDHHLGARKVQCPCASIVGRPHLDQVIRHLEAPSHDRKIKKLRREGRVAADYPTFDRARVLAEQAGWAAKRVSTPSEGQAGPSRVSKRTRLD